MDTSHISIPFFRLLRHLDIESLRECGGDPIRKPRGLFLMENPLRDTHYPIPLHIALISRVIENPNKTVILSKG